MSELATIPFLDTESGDNAVIITRRAGGNLLLAVSIEHGTDAEVGFEAATARRLIAALSQALELLGDAPSVTD